MVYMTPVVGGLIADRYLGARKAVAVGAVLLVLGHFGMTIEGPNAMAIAAHPLRGPERGYLDSLFISRSHSSRPAWALLKTNTATLVGALYEPTDPRRMQASRSITWASTLAGPPPPSFADGSVKRTAGAGALARPERG